MTVASGVGRDKAALFPVGASPPGDGSSRGATGAAMEETNWLKPSDKRVTKYGDSASVAIPSVFDDVPA
jgi:hypothetical protein